MLKKLETCDAEKPKHKINNIWKRFIHLKKVLNNHRYSVGGFSFLFTRIDQYIVDR